MKLKALALSIAMVASVCAANAQTAKGGNDVFVGVGAGISSVMVPEFSTPSFYANIMVGKYITPVWGVRAVIGGPFQTVDSKVIASNFPESFGKNKVFGELNADVLVNFSNIGDIDLAKFDVYAFVGPTLNFASAGSKFSDVQDAFQMLVEEDNTFKVRAGATVGLGLAYNITNSFALGVEGRYGVTPSIFGDADDYRKAEGTTRFALTGVWTIGGKNGKAARAYKAAKKYGYFSQDEVDALIADALEKNPKIVEKPVEKIVEKIVEKGGNYAPAATAVFFEINKANLTLKDKARIKLYADAIKAGSKDAVYEVAGYADKATGSAATNQRLSQKRADVVYDALVAEGVNPSQLVKAANGGVGSMFFDNTTLSRTAIIRVK